MFPHPVPHAFAYVLDLVGVARCGRFGTERLGHLLDLEERGHGPPKMRQADPVSRACRRALEAYEELAVGLSFQPKQQSPRASEPVGPLDVEQVGGLGEREQPC